MLERVKNTSTKLNKSTKLSHTDRQYLQVRARCPNRVRPDRASGRMPTPGPDSVAVNITFILYSNFTKFTFKFLSALPPAQIGLRNVDLNLIIERLSKKVDQTMLENEIEAWVHKFEYNYFLFNLHNVE